MILVKKNEAIVLLYLCCSCLAMSKADDEFNESNQNRQSRGKIFAVKRFGKQIAVGIDFLLPFLKVPTQRRFDQFGLEEPLVSINTASVVITGVLAATGLLIGHIFRSFGLLAFEKAKESEGRSVAEDPDDILLKTLDQFKLVYRNQTGTKIETSLPKLFSTIGETFYENDIDLPSCLYKSLCLLVHKAFFNENNSSLAGYTNLIDGFSSSSWLMNSLLSQDIRDSIKNGQLSDHEFCDKNYIKCKWSSPDEKFLDLIATNFKFI